jgi:hypothetical protein
MKRFALLVALTAACLAASDAQPRSFTARADTGARSLARSIGSDTAPSPNLWGIDVLVSMDGFGAGVFFRRELDDDLSGFLSFSISESKDEREMEMIDPYYGVAYTPGKLNRFLVFPLMAGIQYRLFRDDIVDTFRPYVNCAVGPSMIYMAPFVEFVPRADGSGSDPQQVEFFKSLGRGSPRYTMAAYVGIGANFGSAKSSIFGLNFRYYFNRVFGDGLPSLYNTNSGGVSGTKSDFGGFFITLNVGLGN